jgi:hypothetical protein
MPGQDCKRRTARTGQPDQYRLERTAEIGQTKYVSVRTCQNKTVGRKKKEY